MTQRDAGAAVVLPRTAEGIAENYAGREARRRQSSARICMEHTIGEEKKWRPLQRYLGRRDSYAETHTAIAGLVSDRAARRPTRRHTSTELVLAWKAACCQYRRQTCTSLTDSALSSSRCAATLRRRAVLSW